MADLAGEKCGAWQTKKQIRGVLQGDVTSDALSHNMYSFTSQAQELHGATPSLPQDPPRSVSAVPLGIAAERDVDWLSKLILCCACIGILMRAAGIASGIT
jgi:hypothetical protein